MSRALFLPFALEPALAKRSAALPFPVAARQIPRLLAELVAQGGGDEETGWQCSYLPLVGNEGDRRGFVSFEDLLPLEQVEAALGPQPLPDLLIDGRLLAETLELRAVSPVTGRIVLQQSDIPYDPRDARIAIHRTTIELWDLLDLPGRPPPPPEMPREALGFFLAGKDEELALAANLTRLTAPSPFAPYLAGLQHAPGNRALLSGTLELARLVVGQRRGDAADAATALARAAQGGNCDADFLRSAIDVARGAGDSHALEQLAIPFLQQEPSNAELALAIGTSLASRGLLREGREILRACATAWEAVPHPQGPHVLATLVDLCTELGEDRDAERWADELRQLSGLPTHASEVLARRLRQQGRLDAAMVLLDRAVAREPSASLMLERGRVCMARHDGAGARAALERARDGDELTRSEAERLLRFVTRPELLQELEEVEELLADGRPRPALRRARRATRRAGDLPEAWFLLGLARSALGHRRRAVAALTRALDLLPDFPEARNRRGILLVGLGRYDEGYADLELVLAERDEQLGPLLHMAQACFYLERLDEGAELLARAEALYPDHPAVAETKTIFYRGGE